MIKLKNGDEDQGEGDRFCVENKNVFGGTQRLPGGQPNKASKVAENLPRKAVLKEQSNAPETISTPVFAIEGEDSKRVVACRTHMHTHAPAHAHTA